MSTNVTKIPVEEYCDRFSKNLVSQCFQQIQMAYQKGGQPVADQITINFLSDYVESVVFKVLSENPTPWRGNDEAYDYAVKNLSLWKRLMQEGIAAGFGRAMTAYSGHDVDYLCSITTVPEMIKPDTIN